MMIEQSDNSRNSGYFLLFTSSFPEKSNHKMVEYWQRVFSKKYTFVLDFLKIVEFREDHG